MEGHLHGAILLAILLICLGLLWRRGRQPQLAFPIFTIALTIPLVAANVLVFVFILIFPQYGILDEHPFSESLVTFFSHQLMVFSGCLGALLYGLQWTKRGKSLLIVVSLLVMLLVGGHFIRLNGFERYQVAGTMMMGRREKARSIPVGPCPAFVWHTWLSGLEWDPELRPPASNIRQLALAIQMYMQDIGEVAIPETSLAEKSSDQSRQPNEFYGNLEIPELRFPAVMQNPRLHAGLNAVGLLLVILLTLLVLMLTPWRSIRWREEKWRFAFAPALFLLLIMANSHLGSGNFCSYSPSPVTQWLIPSICLGILGAVMKTSPRVHALVLVVALVLSFGINFQAIQLYSRNLGSGVFTSEYENHSLVRITPVNAWHSWLTGIRFNGKRHTD